VRLSSAGVERAKRREKGRGMLANRRGKSHTALYCTALPCPAVFCTAVHSTTLSYPVLCCTALSFTVLYCAILSCAVLYFPSLHYTVQYIPRTFLRCCRSPLRLPSSFFVSGRKAGGKKRRGEGTQQSPAGTAARTKFRSQL